MTDIILRTDTEFAAWKNTLPDIEDIVQKVKDATFAYLKQHTNIPFLSAPKDIAINLCLSDNAKVHELNRNFRHIDKPTNVLSFANIDFADFKAENDCFEEIELGDIIMAYETVEKEAQIENISFADHFCHLLVHGLLHISGFDHITDAEAEYMEGFEIAILQNLGIANPYEGCEI